MVNITANVALIIDVNARLIGLFNGSSGDVVVWNITSQTGIYITGRQTNRGWLSANISFEAYFESLTSLSFFFQLNVGTRFTARNVTNSVLRIIGNLLGSLSASIAIQIRQNLKVALTILIDIGVSITTLLHGELKGLLKFAESGLIILQGDILWLVNVFKGLGAFFGRIAGGLAYLIEKDIEFKLSILFAAANGVELLINLLLAIVARIDLSVILKDTLNSVETVISLIVQLGGGVSNGVTGVFKIIGGIIGLVNGSVKIEVVIGYLFEFAATRNASGSGEIDISVYFSSLLEVISIQNSTHSNTEGLSGFVSFVGQLVNGTLVVSGVNISQIISSLTAVVQNSIQLIISILVLIGSVVNIVVSIPALILYIIQQLSTLAGSILVKAVFPNVKINISSSSSGGVLSQILHGLKLSDIIRFLLGGINNLLKNLPIIGDIYVAISAALKKATNGKFDLQKILSSSGAKEIVNAIIGFIKGIFTGGVTSQVVTATTKSVTSNWSWSWGVSFG